MEVAVILRRLLPLSLLFVPSSRRRNGEFMKKGGLSQKKKKEIISGYLFILPLFLGLGVFHFYAFFNNIWISLTDRKALQDGRFIGLGNYVKVLHDSNFLRSLGNTVCYVLICVPCILVISVLLAVMLNSQIRGKGIFRTLIFFPLVTAPSAIALTWRWLLNTRYGMINNILRACGMEEVAWLTDERYTLISCAVVIIWAAIGYQVIVILAGLQNISTTYYEAARVDGAGSVRQFFYITLPLLTPTIYFVLTLAVISMFKEFEIVYMLIPSTQYNTVSPAINASRTVVRYFYDLTFRGEFNEGYGSAISVCLFIVILIVTLIQNRLQKKWVFYA